MSIVEKIKKVLFSFFTPRQHRNISAALNWLKTIGSGHDLAFLAGYFNTDKMGNHFYAPHYMTHFRAFRRRRIKLLEIGVGGVAAPDFGGHSLRMWKRYFPRAEIYSVDIYDKSALEESRIRIFRGSQIDPGLWAEVFKEVGEFDLIIDDGSHVNRHVLETFRMLFPRLKSGGIYVIEDTQTSYWPNYEGDGCTLDNPATQMNFYKRLVDGLNYQEFPSGGVQAATEYDRQITSLHFYHNMVFIYKGANDEPSNKAKCGVL